MMGASSQEVQEHTGIAEASGRGDNRPRTRVASILGMFAAIYLLSWPVVFSLDLWILKDRGSFLNLDYLLDQHLRLGAGSPGDRTA